MTEIELEMADEQLHTIVYDIASSFSEESKSYIVGDNLLEELGHAMVNEYITDAVSSAFRCMYKPRYYAHISGKCPVPAHTVVEAVLDTFGLTKHVKASTIDWGRDDTLAPGDVIAYRIVG